MGYAHGTQWNYEKVKGALQDLLKKEKLTYMPTAKQVREFMGNSSLVDAISRHGGYVFWAKELDLPLQRGDTNLGREYELYCMEYLVNEFGFACEQMSIKHPYDLLVGDIKVDVKCANLYKTPKNAYFYTFNLEKRSPTCDIFVCYCLGENGIAKTYVIPAVMLSGKCQLSVGEKTSVYDKYLDRWDLFEKYNEFYENIKNS